MNCPTLCPADCDEDEKYCPGLATTSAACAGEDFCIPKYNETTGKG